MEPRRAPAFWPAVGLVLGLALGGTAPRPVEVWKQAALAAVGLARGGPAGALLLAAAAGLAGGNLARNQSPDTDPLRVARLAGKVCSAWHRRPELPSRSARLCTEWLEQGGRVLTHPPVVWLDLPLDLEPPPIGTTLLVEGRLDRFVGFANLDPVEPGPWRVRVKARFQLVVLRHAGWAGELSERLRRRVVSSFEHAGDPRRPGLALARGFVLGDDGWLTEPLRRALRRCGLAHLLAVSGFNVTVLAVATAFVAGFAGRRLRRTAPLATIAVYLAVVGPEPSLLRAALMAALAIAALSLGRLGGALQALAVAAEVLLVASPDLLSDAGFQLSFGATAGLLLLAGRWGQRGARAGLPRWLALSLGAGLAAQVGAWPFSASAFSQLSPAAPLFNLLAAPWATVWMLMAFVWTVSAQVAPVVARAFVPWLDLAAKPLDALLLLPPGAWLTIWVPAGGPAGLVAAALVCGLIELRPAMRRLALLSLCVSLLLGATPAEREAVGVSFLDVGQGDAALILDRRHAMLIDGGGSRFRDVGRQALWPALERAGIGAVDVAVISHPDLDHCGGLVDLASILRVRELWTSPVAAGARCVKDLASRAARHRLVHAGEEMELGQIRVRVVSAGEVGAPLSDNDDSLVLRIELADRIFLFTGDLEATEEQRLASAEPGSLRCDVLKVAHHGSKSSSSAAFLTAAAPRLAVVSAGRRNGFGHPAPDTLARFEAERIRVLRVDRLGEVRLLTTDRGAWYIDLPALPR